ncbi:MAG: FkbM family methyltransferase [Planctomycetota bacterium]|jgi:FkbM family methyltransferase
MMQGVLFDDKRVSLNPATREYGGSWIPSPNADVLQAYGQPMIKLTHEYLSKIRNPVMLDVGANLGSFCLLAAHNPYLVAYAFEPVRAMYDRLRANITANALDGRVSAFQIALADRVGREEMTVDHDTRRAGLAFLDDREPDMPCRHEMVTVTTLDAWSDKHRIGHVDLIKIDVEGIEKLVMLGGEQTIKRHWPAILFEATNTDETTALMESWGYTLTDYKTDILAIKD